MLRKLHISRHLTVNPSTNEL